MDPLLIKFFVASALGVVIIVSAKAGRGIERYRWRRLQASDPVRHIGAADPDRMERLERAVEAIALELERVGEGQRFVTSCLPSAPWIIGCGRRDQAPSDHRRHRSRDTCAAQGQRDRDSGSADAASTVLVNRHIRVARLATRSLLQTSRLVALALSVVFRPGPAMHRIRAICAFRVIPLALVSGVCTAATIVLALVNAGFVKLFGGVTA